MHRMQTKTNKPGMQKPRENYPPKQQTNPPPKPTKASLFLPKKSIMIRKADIVTAIGDVILNRNGYSLRADTVVWNRKTGEVTAQGNIRSIGPNGDIAYGDSITLTDTLKDGLVENLLLVLNDGGRLAAQRGERTDGILSLDYAAYSPCLVEKPDGCTKRPSWQIKAVKVTYDPAKNRVRYKGARLELFGLPLLPLPGLSHPAETEAGTGFLVPNLSDCPAITGWKLKCPIIGGFRPIAILGFRARCSPRLHHSSRLNLDRSKRKARSELAAMLLIAPPFRL